jgi:hypothetical protein
MKHFVLIMLGLLTLMVLLTGLVFARLAHPRADCRSHVMVFKDPGGERLECVCAEGTLATCFKPRAVADRSPLALPAPCPVQSAEGLALAHQPLGVLDLPAFGHGQHVTGGWARDRRSSKPPQPTYHPTSQRGSEAIACSWLSLTTTTLAGLLLNAALGFERAAIWRWPGMKGFGPRPATCPGVWHDDREGISS